FHRCSLLPPRNALNHHDSHFTSNSYALAFKSWHGTLAVCSYADEARCEVCTFRLKVAQVTFLRASRAETICPVVGIVTVPYEWPICSRTLQFERLPDAGQMPASAAWHIAPSVRLEEYCHFPLSSW